MTAAENQLFEKIVESGARIQRLRHELDLCHRSMEETRKRSKESRDRIVAMLATELKELAESENWAAGSIASAREALGREIRLLGELLKQQPEASIEVRV